jgi:hypothetical protein
VNQPFTRLVEELKLKLTTAVINELLLGESVQEQFKYAVLLDLPQWFYLGIIQSVNAPWSVDDENKMRDLFEFEGGRSFNKLSSNEPQLIGKSFWHFLNNKYGEQQAKRLIFLVRLSRDLEGSIQYLFEQKWRKLLQEWRDYYQEIYKQNMRISMPRNLLPIPLKQTERIAQINPVDSFQIILTVYGQNGISLVLFDAKTNSTTSLDRSLKTEREWLFCSGQLNNQFILFDRVSKTWFQFDDKHKRLVSLAFSPMSNTCNCFVDQNTLYSLNWEKGRSKISKLDSAGWTNIYSREQYLDQLQSKGDGKMVYRLPQYFEDQKQLFFETDLVSGETDTLHFPENTIEIISMPDAYLVLNQKNGILNQFYKKADEDSLHALTHYRRNIEQVSLFQNTFLYEKLLVNKTYGVYFSEIDLSSPIFIFQPKQIANTYEPLPIDLEEIIEDSLKVNEPDTIDYYLQSDYPEEIDFNVILSDSFYRAKSKAVKPEIVPFQDRGYKQDFLVVQLNNDYLFDRAQNPFLPIEVAIRNRVGLAIGATISNIKNTVVVKSYFRTFGSRLGSDLFVDISSGSLFNGPLSVSYFRQGRYASNGNFTSNNNSQIAKLNWFKEMPMLDFGAHITYRNDEQVPLARNEESLNSPIQTQHLQGFQFDFTKTISTYIKSLKQIYSYQVQTDHFYQFANKSWLQDITASLSVENKLSPFASLDLSGQYGLSFGKNKSVFVLGGVDNTIGGSMVDLPYIQENQVLFKPINGVRGFDKNRRSGHHFVQGSAELKLDVVPMIYPYPVRSKFLSHLQMIPFFDAASAWFGTGPYDAINPLQTDIIERGTLEIEVQSLKNPIIYSYGLGFQTKIWGIGIGIYRGFGRETENKKYQRTHLVLGLNI